MFKIIIIGNSAVGKTSIVNRFVGDRFDSHYKATIAADFQVKLLNIQGNEIRLQIWDLVGMDTNYNGINRSFCRNASGAILVADITDCKSLDDLARWKQEVDDIVATCGTPIPMVLAMNKYDLLQEQEQEGERLEDFQTQEYVDAFAQEHGFVGAFRVSAKTDLNISSAFSTLVRQMLIKAIKDEEETARKGNDEGDMQGAQKFQLEQRQKKKKQKKDCKC